MPSGIYKKRIFDTNLSQSERVIEKFGGAKALHSLLERIGEPRSLVSIWRWTAPREKGGTGGLIPTHMWPVLYKAARFEGLILPPSVLDPRPLPMKHAMGIGHNDRVKREEMAKRLRKRHTIKTRDERQKLNLPRVKKP